MFIHQGSIYHLALSPEQKRKKKEYLLQQQVQTKQPVPTWEEVFEEHGHEMHEYIRDSGLFDNFRDEWETQVERWLGVGADQERAEQEAEDFILDKIVGQHYRPFYDDNVSHVEELQVSNNVKCWRAVQVSEDVDPTGLTGFGIYWTLEQEYAEPLMHERSKANQTTVIFQAIVNGKYLNAAETVWANMFGAANNIATDENEVRFYKHAPLYIVDVELEDGTVIEIDEWRHA